MNCQKCNYFSKTNTNFCPKCGSEMPIINDCYFRYANIWNRLFSALIDLTFVFLIFKFVCSVLGLSYFLGIYFLLYFMYICVFNASNKQTIGQKISRIKIVNLDFTDIDKNKAILRALFSTLFSSILYPINFIFAFVSDYTQKKQIIPDYLCKTVVVKLGKKKKYNIA